MRSDIVRAATILVAVLLATPLFVGVALAGTSGVPAGASASGARGEANLEAVARFDDGFKLVGIAVSHGGRIFASAPASGGIHASKGEHGIAAASVVEVNPETGAKRAFPDAGWNHYDPKAPGAHQWIAVQALWVDRANHLWVLDKSAADAPADQPPKLVEFNLATNKVLHTDAFGPHVLQPGDSLNDVRVDDRHDVAYISNAKNGGGILVVNLTTGRARMRLRGDKSSVSDPDQHLMLGKRIARTQSGQIVSIDTDGIALSPNRNWLYYRPLTDHHYYRIATPALIDDSLTPKQRAAKVQYLGDHVLSGGLVMSRAGVLYAGDLEHHGVVALTPTRAANGRMGLAAQIVVHNPKRLAWADGFAIANGYLYIADSHLNETAFSNGYPRSGPFTIFRVPLIHGSDDSKPRP